MRRPKDWRLACESHAIFGHRQRLDMKCMFFSFVLVFCLFLSHFILWILISSLSRVTFGEKENKKLRIHKMRKITKRPVQKRSLEDDREFSWDFTTKWARPKKTKKTRDAWLDIKSQRENSRLVVFKLLRFRIESYTWPCVPSLAMEAIYLSHRFARLGINTCQVFFTPQEWRG